MADASSAADDDTPDGRRTDPPSPELLRAARGGICVACTFAAAVVSSHGSAFLRCRHPHLPKYPPQPLRRCDGFEARRPDRSDEAGRDAS